MFTLLNILFKQFAPLWAPIVDSIRWGFAFVYDQLNKQAYRIRIATLGWQQYMSAWLIADNVLNTEQYAAYVRLKNVYVPSVASQYANGAAKQLLVDMDAGFAFLRLLISGGIAVLKALIGGVELLAHGIYADLRAFMVKWLPLLNALAGDVIKRLTSVDLFAAWILGSLARLAFRWALSHVDLIVSAGWRFLLADSLSLTKATANAFEKVI